jgi:hypothetical protein
MNIDEAMFIIVLERKKFIMTILFTLIFDMVYIF